MPPPTPRRSRPLQDFASLAIALIVLAFAPSIAAAQSPGPLQRYSMKWYGRNFYDHQHNGHFHGAIHRQNTLGNYGPPMIYDRQYGDQYGYATARPFRPALPFSNGDGYGPDPFTRY